MRRRLGAISKILAVAGIAAVIFTAQPAYAQSESHLSAFDTVANFESMIKADSLPPLSAVTFVVAKPDGSIFKKTAQADASGKANVVMPDTDTVLAGIYKASIDGRPGSVSFTVFPGDTDVRHSAVYSTKGYLAANGVDFALVTVRIADAFGNPLPYHEVHLTSSRSADTILERANETDANGIASFAVTSREPGVSVFTATDESAQSVISQRLTITFTKAQIVQKAIGGDPETLLLAQAGQTVAGFSIENLPASVKVNDTLSFSVSAVDPSAKVVPSYTGTIVFSSTDPNAQLPSPYTFKSSDQGRMTFNVILSFRTPGTQKVSVQEQGNALLKGEKTIEVLSGQGVSGGQVKITKPATGTYSVNTFEIAGESNPNSTVKLFDNGQQITTVQANTSGRFSFNTSLLTDGQHTFSAQSNGVDSTPVVITIDTTPAQVEQVDISKTTLGPGETTSITIRSDPDLNAVQLTVGELIADLERDPQNPGIYRGTITAPQKDGDYTVNIIITDQVGNVSPAIEVGKINVDASLRTGQGSATSSVPSVVNGFKATPGNAKVTLTWSAAQAEAGIAFYRIYYGTDPSDLHLVANTKDSKTTWYIPSLLNGTPYYFKVVGVDTENNEGDTLSALVSATPSESASDSVALCDPGPCPADAPSPNEIPQDGPEVMGIIVASIAGSSVYSILRRKKRRR